MQRIEYWKKQKKESDDSESLDVLRPKIKVDKFRTGLSSL
jgi:hypothetical protein